MSPAMMYSHTREPREVAAMGEGGPELDRFGLLGADDG